MALLTRPATPGIQLDPINGTIGYTNFTAQVVTNPFPPGITRSGSAMLHIPFAKNLLPETSFHLQISKGPCTSSIPPRFLPPSLLRGQRGCL